MAYPKAPICADGSPLYRDPRPSQCVEPVRVDPDAEEIPPTHWAILWTAPRREQVVHDELVRLGYGAFLPLETVTKDVPLRLRARFGPRRDVVQPVLRRYVFAGLDPDRQPWALISCEGVVGVERVETLWAQARLQRELDVLRAAHAAGDFDLVKAEAEKLRAWLEAVVGEQVRVVKGPFAGEDGVCEARVGKRLAIRVGPLRLTVDHDAVEKAP